MKLVPELEAPRVHDMAILKQWNARWRHLSLTIIAAVVRARRVSADDLRSAPLAKLLVVRPDDRIGNLLFITPLLAALRARFPRAGIDVVVSSRYHEVLSHHPAISRLITVDRRGFRRRPLRMLRAIRHLRRFRYDVVFDCKAVPSLSTTLVVLLARRKWTVGFDHEFARAVYSHAVSAGREEPLHESARLYRLIGEIWPSPPCGPMEFFFPPDRSPDPAPRGISLHIGGHGRKRIPIGVLSDLIGALSESGHPLEILGGPDDLAVIAALETNRPGLVLTRPPDVIELARGMAGSRVFIGPDTGALHLASALDIPTVNLCNGREDPAFASLSSRHIAVDVTGEGAVERTMSFVDEVLGNRDSEGSAE